MSNQNQIKAKTKVSRAIIMQVTLWPDLNSKWIGQPCSVSFLYTAHIDSLLSCLHSMIAAFFRGGFLLTGISKVLWSALNVLTFQGCVTWLSFHNPKTLTFCMYAKPNVCCKEEQSSQAPLIMATKISQYQEG